MINNLANFSSSEITSIDTPIIFGIDDHLTLFPNKTLRLGDYNTSYDRDGPYNWNSSLTSKGTWEYTDKREIILKFHSFEVNNNGKHLTEEEVSKFNLPTEVTTQNFFFEAPNFINCITS
jgi:hypothetical protein